MSRLIKLIWESQPGSGLSRRDRLGCEYKAFIPDDLSQIPLSIDAGVAAEISKAELAISELNRDEGSLADSEAIARLLLRTESVASSRIEGLEIGNRRLLKAEISKSLEPAATDVTATEVMGNIEAMKWAVETMSQQPEISIEGILQVHELLLRGSALAEHGGRFREVQNWVGGSDFNPCAAEYVPPPPDAVPGLMKDLCDFCNRQDLPAVAQAGLAHSQFETIHPFVDGNGRTGRALIHVILRRRGLAPRIVPPISLVMASWSNDYVNSLMATRYEGDQDSWLSFFAGACTRAAEDAQAYEDQIAELQDMWRGRLGKVRKGSAADLLLKVLPSAPIITVQSATTLISRSGQAVNEAIARLEEAKILKQTTIGRRNRAFEAADAIEAFTALERQLASPGANTRTSPPVRPVPARPQV